MRGRNVQHANMLRDQARELRRTMTPTEMILWKYLRGNLFSGLHFRRQQVIDGFIVDFCCHAARLVIEVDGSIHDQQRDYDAERDRILRTRGLRVLRFTNDRIANDLSACLMEIREAAGSPRS
jgi:very-short-patch-repair endonuclease